MPSPSTLAAFSGGPRVGALSALGVETANAVYVVATALGLTALLAASTVAFTTIRYAGAAYLVYLGVRTLRDRGTALDAAVPSVSPTSWTSWRQGFLVGIGNPKAALFFLALFPQFLHADAGAVWSQVLVLGAITVAIGVVLDVGYGVFGGLARARIARSGRALRRGRLAVGVTYLGLGGLAAATGHRPA
jgi:threonine/homoserine/homoserine lactone efflux protein